MNKTEKQLNKLVKDIHDIQNKQIMPLECEVEICLQQLFPQLNQEQINDWLMDVIYTDSDNALKRMKKLFN
jgi:hypothetical protein